MNAQAIHSAILAAAAVAPECHVDVSLTYSMQQRASYALEFGIEDANLKTSDERIGMRDLPARLDCETRETIQWAQERASDAAYSELQYAEGWQAPKFVTFQTSSRGRMKVCNTRARLTEFAATIKANQRAFGGGIKPTARAKPAQTWSPNVIKVIRESMQDRQYADAVRLAEDKAGALFYPTSDAKCSLMLVAPVDCPDLSGLVTAQRANDGAWVVMDVKSGCTVGNSGGSRATAVRNAKQHMEYKGVTVESISGAIARAKPVDQDQARADFLAHFGIVDADEAVRLAAEAIEAARASSEECTSEDFATV